MTEIDGLMALNLSTPTALLPEGPLDCHTSICGGSCAENTTSEQGALCFVIYGGTILAGAND
jgi:hypothetical protein